MRIAPIVLALTVSAASLGWNVGLAHATRAHAAKADATAIAASIASPERPAADRERDSWAKPEVVLTFLGARPGMHVIDYMGGSGYYSELLGRVVGPQGQVILYNNDGYASYAGQGLAKRFDGRHVPNILQKVEEISALKLPPKSLDAALFVMSYHDVYFTPPGAHGPMGDATQMVQALFEALKPGGIVVVQDHVAATGTDPAQGVDKLHRIDPAQVMRTFEQAGFKLDARSDAFSNSGDDHSKLVFDPSIRHKTDQFLFRFRKP